MIFLETILINHFFNHFFRRAPTTSAEPVGRHLVRGGHLALCLRPIFYREQVRNPAHLDPARPSTPVKKHAEQHGFCQKNLHDLHRIRPYERREEQTLRPSPDVHRVATNVSS